MAAEIKPAQSGSRPGGATTRRLALLAKIEGFVEDVHDAVFIDGQDVIVTASEDKSVRIWQRRDTGQFWPSVCQYMPSPATCLLYTSMSSRLYVGLDNGTVCEFQVSSDRNRMTAVRDYLAHHGRVTACQLCSSNQWVMSVSRDKTFQYHCVESGRRLDGHQMDAWCTCLGYDALSRHAFIGDYSGTIHMLQLDDVGCTPITKLGGHTSSVRALVWDPRRQWLFSGSFDHSIIVWDIGGGQGNTYELHGHSARVTTLSYHRGSSQLISGSDDGSLMVWDMSVTRKQPVEWVESDTCQLCSKPFFWNLKAMYDSKQLGLNRQHHCRNCGRAVCDACSGQRCCIPLLGHELPTRVCQPCHNQLQPSAGAAGGEMSVQQPLAVCHEARHQLVAAAVDPLRPRLVTAGRDRVVKLWELTVTPVEDAQAGSAP